MTRQCTNIALALLVALFLTACGTTTPPEPVIRTITVNVPVPVKCAPNIGPGPDYPDTDEALASVPDIFQGVAILKAGRILRIPRERELLAALKGCAGEN